jgi:hypothetical protein
MNTDSPNETHNAEAERPVSSLTLDQESVKRWLGAQVTLTLPRRALVAGGLMVFILLLAALD